MISFVKNDCNQISLNDSTFALTERERKLLNKSWTKPFADKLFPVIKEEDFAVLYSDKASWPNPSVNVIIGVLILKEILGLTDDEILESLILDSSTRFILLASSSSH